MLISRNHHKVKAERRSDHGWAMANARWAKHRRAVAENPPPLSDANRVHDFLEARRGKLAFTNDRVDHSTREVVTWVMRGKKLKWNNLRLRIGTEKSSNRRERKDHKEREWGS